MASISLKYKSKQGSLTAPGDVDPGAMIPIATTTVGSGGAANVEFTNIPTYYEHLQIRAFCRTTWAGGVKRNLTMRFNSDTGQNYATHYLQGNGTSATAAADINSVEIYVGWSAASDGAASIFASNVIDILDYSNTNKFKTVRTLCGYENNLTNGSADLRSGLWRSTSAITSIVFDIESNFDFAQYSHFALYGIKRAGA
jgi:hypothetical protein